MPVSPWSVEGESRRICGCWNCSALAGAHPPCPQAALAAKALRAGLARAAVICGKRATNAVASRMTDYRQGQFDEAEACERAIMDAAK